MKLINGNLDKTPKIGRNDPCTCGSGKKYKKCCLHKNDFPSIKSGEMESIMKQIAKIAESKNMSVDDMNEYFVGKNIDKISEEYETLEDLSLEEKAQNLLYEAMDENDSNVREKLAKKALSLYPNLPDAYIILEEQSKSLEESLDYFKMAVEAGEKNLGLDYFKENAGLFWGLMETRPYMRAKALLADTLWNLSKEDEAIFQYQECIRLNPNDNQGIRDTLLTCLLIKNDLKGVEELLEQYKDDIGASYAYSKLLYTLIKYGIDSVNAKDQLKTARQKNSFIENYLLDNSKLPSQTPYSYSLNSEEEAIIYAEKGIKAWNDHPGAIKWLRDNHL